MSNHVHLIVCAKEGFRLSDIVRDCKKFTSKEIIDSIFDEPESREAWLIDTIRAHGLVNPNNEYYQLWQQNNHAVELYDLKRFHQRMNYIHQNPVRAGIVLEPEHYLYSSARNYAGLKSPLEVTLMEEVPMSGYLPPM
jgi:REP element-mobilizing transposase RayT